MTGEIAAMLLLLLFGCAAFVISVVFIVGRIMAGMWRGFTWLAGGSCCETEPTARADRGWHTGDGRVCPRPQCRKVEYRPARFCSQCGHRFPDGGSADGSGGYAGR